MKFKIFLIYHSHIDIGYTERQEKIAVYQSDFIKQAVDFVLDDSHRDRDGKNSFKFTAEGFWAVENYLRREKEAGRRKLLRAIGTGRFELTAGYLHFAELLNGKNLNRSLDYCSAFCRENGIESPRVAVASDINGFSWGYADALIDHSVKYLITNINTHHGGAPFSKPLVPFYWIAPSGRKLLVWNGLTYHKANLLGLIPGLTPIGDPGVPGMSVTESGFIDIQNTDYAAKRIFTMVETLKKNGYGEDFLPLMGSGLYTDNSPVGDGHCELLREWNDKYGDQIEIVTGTVEEFFEYLLKNRKDIPSYGGDWNDWWTDGVVSTPNETRIFRHAQRTESLIEMLDPDCRIVPAADREEAVRNLILYAEHTWGHSASLTDPAKLLVAQLDARKARLAFEADVIVGKSYDTLARALGEGEFRQKRPLEYVIVNPLNVRAKKEVYLPTDFWEEGLFADRDVCVYDGDRKLSAQRTYTLRGAFVACVLELEARERRTLRVVPCDKTEDPPKRDPEWFEVEKDERGISEIRSFGERIFERKNGEFCEPVYQIFRGGNRADAAGFGYGSRKKPKSEILSGKATSFCVAEDGPVFTKYRYGFDVEGSEKTNVDLYLYKDLPKIVVEAEFAKSLVTDPEGMYVRFPLRVKGGEWYLDKAGAIFKPGNQLPDTCCDYYPVYRGAALRGDELLVTVNCYDTPLVTFNKIKLWDFTLKAENTGDLYSWITNNKWETNFRSQCAGFLQSRYCISVGKDSDIGSRLEENEYDFLVLRK